MGGRRVRGRRTGLRSRICSTCLQRSAGVECSLTPKGDLRANQGVMAMSREGASASYWRYRSGSQKLTMSTSRTARRPSSGAPVHPIAALRFAPFGLGRPAFALLEMAPVSKRFPGGASGNASSHASQTQRVGGAEPSTLGPRRPWPTCRGSAQLPGRPGSDRDPMPGCGAPARRRALTEGSGGDHADREKFGAARITRRPSRSL